MSVRKDEIERRLERMDWAALECSLDERGYATTPLLRTGECLDLAALYSDERRFRSRVDMARYRFGVGEYKYFTRPLPRLVSLLRHGLYARLAPIADRWAAALGGPKAYPQTLEDYLRICAASGQIRPTPLLLRYTAGGYNCLHQDLYGTHAFPLQVTVALSARGKDYAGGENLLVEQRPRAQSRGEVIALEQGQALVFPTRFRPIAGARGYFRAVVRHGVSRLHAGTRLSLGIIFHDAA
jgi:hypothetical protein